MPPRVTTIVTCYNHERYIRQAVESAAGQVVQGGHEIVVLDDCSTDNTVSVLRALAFEYPGLVHIRESQVNECSSRQTAVSIRESAADYVAFLDGDDYWTSPHKIQRQIDALDANPDCSMCSHDVWLVYEDGSRPAHVLYPEKFHRMRLGDLFLGNPIPGCSPLIRRSALAELGPWFETALFGDWPLYLIAGKHGDIEFLSEPLGVYRVHREGMWSRLTDRQGAELVVQFLESIVDPEILDRCRTELDSALRYYYRLSAAEAGREGDADAAARWSAKADTLNPA
jgi:glycosyltransferase involved in cell wall biosynthesis